MLEKEPEKEDRGEGDAATIPSALIVAGRTGRRSKEEELLLAAPRALRSQILWQDNGPVASTTDSPTHTRAHGALCMFILSCNIKKEHEKYCQQKIHSRNTMKRQH